MPNAHHSTTHRATLSIAVCFVFLMSATALRAQSSTGEIDVILTDATEATISDARVTITGAETGAVVRELTTNVSGLATAPLLNPGRTTSGLKKKGSRRSTGKASYCA